MPEAKIETMIEAKSVITKALAVACPNCKVSIGEPCRRANGRLKEIKGHLGVCWPRMLAAQHVRGDST